MGGHPSDPEFFNLWAIYLKLYGLRVRKHEWEEAMRWHETKRSRRSRSLDEAKLARIARSYEEWRRHPNKYDLPGVDTPEVGFWRRFDPFEFDESAKVGSFVDPYTGEVIYVAAPVFDTEELLGVTLYRG